jgi:hypothetical protein
MFIQTMNASISTIRGIGPVVTDIFHQVGYETIADLIGYNGNDRIFMEVINTMKQTEPLFPQAHWRRLCTRCVNVIYRVRYATAQTFVPYYLMCPISLDLMTDPVISPSGISYDRDNIEEWLLTNNTEPITMIALSVEQLYPNRSLRDTIEYYRRNHQMFSI